MIIDVFNDPYSRKLNAHIKRKEFEKIKQSRGFKLWKQRQVKVQENKCAYCKICLDKKYIITHIDHVTPLYYDGKNNYSNYVLSCKKCNLKKWVSNRYTIPDWIKYNDNKIRQESRLKSFRQKQKRQINGIIDDIILEDILLNI